jgi:hypothetical protein
MLSLILYGRNDSYGYNLHKRAAISLNCMAEVLTAPGDEIIFVDYNTPDDFPTFPEAIQDTLTDRAKTLLRILRVRPSQHERFRSRTELLALEPVARNVAIRRSNPDNRWILSTNTDMVFVPRRGKSLSDIAQTLPDAYYHLPRFEIPESLWESLDRLDPAGTIATIGAWGYTFHLNEIAFSTYPSVRYDGPGDFQLILRSDLWCVHGFHESMLLGWHVDSNMAQRLSLFPRPLADVVDDVFVYHCDHTRQLTRAHRPRGAQNDIMTYFHDVAGPDVPEQSETWGLAGEHVEELKANTTSRLYVEGLRSAIPFPLLEPTELMYTGTSHERIDYSVDHALPFLAGVFAAQRRDTVLGWFGTKKSLLWRFAATWKAMGFFERIKVFEEGRWLGPDLPPSCMWGNEETLDENCQVFAFDFGKPEGEHAAQGWESDATIDIVANGFQQMVRRERIGLATHARPPRLFVGVNPRINGSVNAMFNEAVAAALTPMSTRIQHGFVTEPREPQDVLLRDELDCMPMVIVGPAGARAPAPRQPRRDAIHAKPGAAGWLVVGPYMSLLPGSYDATFELFAERAQKGAALSVDVAAEKGRRILAQRRVKPHEQLCHLDRELRPGPLTCTLGFDVGSHLSPGSSESVEFRVWSPGTISFCLVGLRLRQVASSP